ncbi:alpha-2,8-polysialyltransferase (POLYST) [Bisgaardia hudsonensis]|uniref:Alpha-2,8-polysialyltransferase (POLYST) n=1 Tax=Bisgaardia hudsonensis TaxID=109472 RepID=A0A4R2N313_9PAST|nr:alpha-2,8-polysialyltransferase family protein [Bisgaardia hudsonensis]QLB12718.1 hypothetical protein A6A11_03410 [Bisgaardia hudsonensis]TCP14268.1 alpha-2,8-polysialyltransferase (POLYST) [Bisgaardia hudsonensis]
MFRKFMKLIKTPVEFVRDSYFFKCGYMGLNFKCDNLFVVSNLGQLNQAHSLIKKERFKNNFLLILYTSKNKVMPEIVKKNVDSGLFSSFAVFRLPNKPSQINIKNAIYINNSYRNIINTLKIKNLFIQSFERHYALLASYAKSKNIKVNLIEEGTGTYRYSTIHEFNRIFKESLSWKERKQMYCIKHLCFFKNIRPMLSIYHDYNTIYAAFPHLVPDFFTFRKKEYFFLYDNIKIGEDIRDIKLKYNITSNDIIFLNQRYKFTSLQCYAKSLLLLLSEFSLKYKCNVFIKLHPKDSEEFKVTLRNYLKKYKIRSIILIDFYGFTIEPLLIMVKPRFVLGMTSSGLIYSSLLSKTIQSATIYPILREKIDKELVEDLDGIGLDVNNDIFSDSDKHFEILSKFPSTKIISLMDEI